MRNGIPPNSKLPDFIVKKIEARALDIKKGTYKGAMVAEFGEEEYDDDDDDDGHAFVACCYQVDEDRVAVMLEDEDDDTEETNACGYEQINVVDASVPEHAMDNVHARDSAGTCTPVPVTAVSDDDDEEEEEVPDVVNRGDDEDGQTLCPTAHLTMCEEKTTKKTTRPQIYLDMNSSTDDDDTDDEMPPLEKDNVADALQLLRESPTHEEKSKMDESAQWHMGKVSSEETEVQWAI